MHFSFLLIGFQVQNMNPVKDKEHMNTNFDKKSQYSSHTQNHNKKYHKNKKC